MRKLTRGLAGLATAAVAAGVAGPALATTQTRPLEQVSPRVAVRPGSGHAVIDWNRELITLLGTPGLQPPAIHPTRSFAMLQAAEYDAVVSITHSGKPYRFSVRAPRDARPDAAAEQAAHDVLVALYPAAKASIDKVLAGELGAIPDGHGKRDGIRVGATVAQMLVGLRAGDGSAATPPPFVAGNQPGDYRPTPPSFPAPVFTNWGSITPFLLTSGHQFRPAAPPSVRSLAYARALNQVKSLGQDTSTARTADQTTAAKFWGSAPIWNTWNEITQKLLAGQHASLQRSVTVFANLDLTIADTAIALYDGKYFYRVWRPVTAIRLGNTGYNPGIPSDPNAPNWTPLAVTAADPSYPGAHSTISAAAAAILTALLGPNRAIIVTSDKLPGVTRSFASLQAAAKEAGLSRIFAGQHTRLDHRAGTALGRTVAQFTMRQLQSDHADAAA